MLHRHNFRAMGSDMLVLLDMDSEQPPKVLTRVPDWFEKWEQALSRFRQDSELSLLNQTFDQPVHVSPVFWEVFEASQWAELYTNGLVTPTVYDAMIESGYDRSFDALPKYQEYVYQPIASMVQPLSVVLANKAEQTICLPGGVHLDFGGVAKGWSAHQAIQKLKAKGPALVNAGGDIAIGGPQRDGAAWKIGVKNPFGAEPDFEVLNVKRGGVATSGRDHRRWMQNGLLRHHIINPLTGLPAETDLLTATVVAPTVMEAEAASKAVMILGAEDGLAWIESKDELAGLLVLENGQAWYSQRMQEYL